MIDRLIDRLIDNRDRRHLVSTHTHDGQIDRLRKSINARIIQVGSIDKSQPQQAQLVLIRSAVTFARIHWSSSDYASEQA